MARRSSLLKLAELSLGCLMVAGTAAQAQAPGASVTLQPLLAEVSINGQSAGEPQLLLTNQSGATYASGAALKQWRLRVPATGAVMFEGEAYYRLDTIPSLETRISEADQSLLIDAAAAAFEAQRADLHPATAAPLTPVATGAFFNYDAVLEIVRGGTGIAGAFEGGFFTEAGVGVTSFVGRAGSGKGGLTRLETNWTIDRPSRMSSIRIGDAFTRGSQHAAPLRFAGVQYGRNFAVQPGFVTMPLPSLDGSAAVQSVVDIYVNNTLHGTREVAPGPFQIANLPVQSGGGSVQLVTRDLLGRESVSTQDYYASSALLRPRLHDFSYEIGFVRRDFGIRSNSYGALMASASHRAGISSALTVEGSLQASGKRQVAGAALAAAWPRVGMLTASAAISRDRAATGTALGLGFERRTAGLSLGIRSELNSAGYRFIGLPGEYELPRRSIQAFADAPLGRATIGLNYLERHYRFRPDERLIGAFATLGIGGSASLQLFARRTAAGRASTSIGGSIALALGAGRSGSASLDQSRGDTLSAISLQQDTSAGEGSGYRLSGTAGAVDSALAGFTLRARAAAFSAEAAIANGRAGLRVSAAGAFGLIGGTAFASRALGSSFGLVELARQPGVRVYADNQLVGVTDARGRLVLPTLRAWEPNAIRIDDADLPIDVQLAAPEQIVRPAARSGAIVTFAARRERGTLLQVQLEDGSWLPAGAQVRDAAGAALIAVTDGEVYVPDLGQSARFDARWPGGSCTFTASAPAGDDPQPRIHGIICSGTRDYAAR